MRAVIWGASGHSLVVADLIQLGRSYELAGLIDDVNSDKYNTTLCGLKVIGGREQISHLKHEGISHIAIGFGHCSARIRLGDYLIEEKFNLVTLCHPHATIANNTEIQVGTVVLAGAVVGPRCIVGAYSIINNNVTVSHDVTIGKGVHVCPGVHIGGGVNIGASSWIGIGSCIIDCVSIGSGSYIGAGSVVVNDIPDGVLVYGNPARVARPIDFEF